MTLHPSLKRPGATPYGVALPELLLVAALIAVLTAIAAPNFWEAQTRSKISRARENLALGATALQAYSIDFGQYPYDGNNWNGVTVLTPNAQYNFWYLPPEISTPVAYLASDSLRDPFRNFDLPNRQWNDIRYNSMESTWGSDFDELQSSGPGDSLFLGAVLQEYGGFRLVSAGPDRSYGPTGWQGISNYPANPLPYDPTNGTFSSGDLLHSALSPRGYLNTH